MTSIGAQGVGIANIAMTGEILDTWYPTPELITDPTILHHPHFHTHSTRLGAQDLPPKLLSLVKLDDQRLVEQVAIRTTIRDLNEPPTDAHDVYLRLHLLSHRLCTPGEINMDDAIAILNTVVWTNKGPCLPDNFEHMRTSLRSRGLIHVYGIDPLPRMVDYVVPSGVQISEAERVRLGAYLAPGTRVMREGFVSHNAGTLGPCRIEGRITSGTIVGEHSTLQLSSSLISSKPVQMRVGKNCSFGISATVLGLSLGDNVHIGHKVVLDPHTPIRMGHSNEVAPARFIEGTSHLSIAYESGFTEPVARPLNPDNPAVQVTV
ncbi:succinyltransferase [Corynebacterium felinum]|uniref:2,3,4,5-tetrahydropyridine-2-carboxylate N-succinyltransferase n=1 Tax=Corynebacterium felinum TaxID=131318 RepID=A0ABU2B9A9_9CORY|nr:succinyltransferase [Corynebacterium felinum]MDF5821246.1 succinyltransferase [Corynebacterium felinum]MDR7355235.1 2,3,4,5-tetrahydropyridine-2-carboxylate N-succinyltransferase [Corynebacterium felinum]WJY94586.1 2,3,4,5-tetrahydropyridine-2,6-dicarboxylate N-succinyltransferase [Corynebacterium felinum]